VLIKDIAAVLGNAFKNSKTPLVPTLSMGTDGKGTLVEALVALAAAGGGLEKLMAQVKADAVTADKAA
jgi:hypothetical protein